MKYIIAGILHLILLLVLRHFFGFEVALLYGLMTFNMETIKGKYEILEVLKNNNDKRI